MTWPRERSTCDLALTGVIVAGGLNTRMGRVKGLMPFAGQPLVLRSIAAMKQVCGQLLIVTNEPSDFAFAAAADPAVRIITDLIPHRGPMSGLHAALAQSEGSWFWAVGSDMPFISGAAALWQLDRLRASGRWAAVPSIGSRLHPLHAVYHADCLPSLEAALHSPHTGLIRWLSGIPSLLLTEEEFAEVGLFTQWADSFNDHAEYERCLERAEQEL
ncbi:molybdopterin-guanine dinucleotide biosynthesis protein A [Paenibacillus sp. UNCCL117]|uniref:molybdenum cofactor guanylyltransferase n=1 Tax=unclassified Paenibacillus TaxID=185978 RepID=UPI00088D6C7A|nr:MULTISPECIES: molybdenum cofactor guanylyltransferase [unclassified Paenibacillus]SDE29821.1 molybdenum cofactor guanylyltransferase [Paenibacillus sp. cl123]SFW63189.1 molybdopterin-guanine dinucleotide biosynthesis protein A [Paenibacillus sp. UNCCL117]